MNATQPSVSGRAGVPSEVRRRVARTLAARQNDLLDSWLANHRSVPAVAEHMATVARGEAAYRHGYLRPLLTLLNGWIERGDSAYGYVYRDERRRVFGTLTSPDAYAQPLRGLLAADTESLASVVAEPAEEKALRELLGALHAPLLEAASRDLGILLVGDCLMTEIRAFLTAELQVHGVHSSPAHIYFSAGYGHALATGELADVVGRDRPELIALSFFTFEGLPPFTALLDESDQLSPAEAVDRVSALIAVARTFLEELRDLTDATVLVHGACGLPLNRYRKRIPLLPPLSRGRRRVLDALNTEVAELVEHTENAIFVDEAALAAEHGLRRLGRPVFREAAMRDAVFHTSRFGMRLAERHAAVARAFAQLRGTKVLLLDFDNTLWRGVMAEEEVVHDEAGQRLLHRLREAGILLVSVSKNDPRNIRWDELALGFDDFVLHKVSWNQKAMSIAEAAQELDLGLDSFVLIDDSPVERELVQRELPAVRTLDPLDSATWQALEWMLEFPNTRRTAEAARRTEIYREAAARRSALVDAPDYEAMMGSLELRAEVRHAEVDDVDRIHELLDRTNQFNTTTIRRSRPEVRELIESPDHGVYVASLADKFGDLGSVAAVVVARGNGEVAFESFVMSCRAMGFGLELLVMSTIVEREASGRAAVGRFVPSGRNGPAAGLFAQAGFTRTAENEWRLDQGEPRPARPAWFAAAEHAS